MITIFFSSYQGKPKKSFFLFLKILPFFRSICFSLKTFPTSPLISFFFLSPFFSFSLGANPSKIPRFFPHAFSSPHTEFPPRISQKPFFFFFLPNVSSFLQNLSNFILSIRTTPFFFPFSFGNPHLQPWNPNSFSSPLPGVGSCLLITS